MRQGTLDHQRLEEERKHAGFLGGAVSKWFADEMEDTGLQTAENSKFFGIAPSIVSFSNAGKELFVQQPETSNAAHTGQFDQIVWNA